MKTRGDFCLVDALDAIVRLKNTEIVSSALSTALIHPTRECSRRAATYGLSVAGPAGLSALLVALGDAPDVAVTAAHALGNCVDDAVITSTSADINAVIKALQLACANAVQQIEEYESTRTKAELAVAAKASPRGEVYRAEVAVDFYVTDRRRVAAACLKSLGLIGARAVRLGDEAASVSAATAILPMAMRGGEAGGVFPSHMNAATVTQNAEDAVLRMCSDSQLTAPTFGGGEGGTLGEAQRRWQALVERGERQGGRVAACRRAVGAVLERAWSSLA